MDFFNYGFDLFSAVQVLSESFMPVLSSVFYTWLGIVLGRWAMEVFG